MTVTNSTTDQTHENPSLVIILATLGACHRAQGGAHVLAALILDKQILIGSTSQAGFRDEVSWFHNSSHPTPINRGPPRGRSNWRQGELSDPALLVPHLWSNPPALGTKPKLPSWSKKISTAGKDGNETALKKTQVAVFFGKIFDVGSKNAVIFFWRAYAGSYILHNANRMGAYREG